MIKLEGVFETPVLLLLFNRPDKTKKVIDLLRKIKPKQVFVSADGPRPGNKNDKILCSNVRELIVSYIDWDCKIFTLYNENNLGCGLAVSRGIDWFFKQVDYGIILEDDCILSESFFSFSQELLVRYKDRPDIMMIRAINFIHDEVKTLDSYYFSNIPYIWGWATWARAWKLYDYNMTDWSKLKRSMFQNKFSSRILPKYFTKRYDRVYKGGIDTWDTQWVYTIHKNNGITIVPSVNMVRNIGFDEMATHTLGDTPSYVKKLRLYELKSIQHPDFVNVNFKMDEREGQLIYNPSFLSKLNAFIAKFKLVN